MLTRKALAEISGHDPVRVVSHNRGARIQDGLPQEGLIRHDRGPVGQGNLAVDQVVQGRPHLPTPAVQLVTGATAQFLEQALTLGCRSCWVLGKSGSCHP